MASGSLIKKSEAEPRPVFTGPPTDKVWRECMGIEFSCHFAQWDFDQMRGLFGVYAILRGSPASSWGRDRAVCSADPQRTDSAQMRKFLE